MGLSTSDLASIISSGTLGQAEQIQSAGVQSGVGWTGSGWQPLGPPVTGQAPAANPNGVPSAGVIPGPSSVTGVGPVHYVPGLGYVSDATGQPISAAQGNGGAGGAAAAGGAGLNVPNGTAYFNPVLQAMLQLLGMNQQSNQFAAQQELAAGSQLANLSAQGGSAAELAYRRAGLGMPAAGGNDDIENLIVNSTAAAGRPVSNTIGDFSYALPGTLTGKQTRNLANTPNTAAVIGSYAKAAGAPDYLTQSIRALLPSGFAGVGAGVG